MLSSYFNNSQSDTTLSNKTLEKNKLFKKFFQKLRKIFNKNTVKIYFLYQIKAKLYENVVISSNTKKYNVVKIYCGNRTYVLYYEI